MLSCHQQKSMPPKNIPSHTTQLSTGYTDNYLLKILAPLWRWAKGLGPACTPTSLGSDPPPALLGPQGPEGQASGGGGSDGSGEESGEPQWDRQKQGHRDSNQDPELRPRGPGRLWPVHRAEPQSRRQALPTLSAEVSRSWLYGDSQSLRKTASSWLRKPPCPSCVTSREVPAVSVK